MNIDVALAGVFDRNSPDRGARIRALVESDDASVDAHIEALLEEHSRSMAVAPILCRVLAERRPDRDPSYVLEFFGKGRKGDPADWLVRRSPYRSPALCYYGIPRLRLLKPVEHLARDLGQWSAHRRGIAVVGLGDTADPEAARLVAGRLKDWRSKIRVAAADSIRRLARDGALPPESLDVVGDGLVACLFHRKEAVVRHAAAALAVPALKERLVLVRQAGTLSPSAASEVDDVLAGTVVSLREKLWPGEIT
ncbi:hypothetical protein GCM10011609_63550 [Lentzea pudingi]|uniref:HEAT repeat-containing protein n=1 Tax=Lentzea pudingi TaxID=1789439 RepID=A0ABQ2IJG9_9PSEU|nr:hypothetical protein [Lentzea pudingi]GGN14268.1 hypothetical protein GCM10011609_63550 [Lentzea pudingi]